MGRGIPRRLPAVAPPSRPRLRSLDITGRIQGALVISVEADGALGVGTYSAPQALVLLRPWPWCTEMLAILHDPRAPSDQLPLARCIDVRPCAPWCWHIEVLARVHDDPELREALENGRVAFTVTHSSPERSETVITDPSGDGVPTGSCLRLVDDVYLFRLSAGPEETRGRSDAYACVARPEGVCLSHEQAICAVAVLRCAPGLDALRPLIASASGDLDLYRDRLHGGDELPLWGPSPIRGDDFVATHLGAAAHLALAPDPSGTRMLVVRSHAGVTPLMRENGSCLICPAECSGHPTLTALVRGTPSTIGPGGG